jgi:hypothetical protein
VNDEQIEKPRIPLSAIEASQTRARALSRISSLTIGENSFPALIGLETVVLISSSMKLRSNSIPHLAINPRPSPPLEPRRGARRQNRNTKGEHESSEAESLSCLLDKLHDLPGEGRTKRIFRVRRVKVNGNVLKRKRIH